MGGCSSCCANSEDLVDEKRPLLIDSDVRVTNSQRNFNPLSFSQAHINLAPSDASEYESQPPKSPQNSNSPQSNDIGTEILSVSELETALEPNTPVEKTIKPDVSSKSSKEVESHQTTPIKKTPNSNKNHGLISPGQLPQPHPVAMPPSPIPQPKARQRKSLKGTVATTLPTLDTLIKSQQAEKHRLSLQRLVGNEFQKKINMCLLMANDSIPTCLHAAISNLINKFEKGTLDFNHTFKLDDTNSFGLMQAMTNSLLDDARFIFDEDDSNLVAHHIRSFLFCIPEPLAGHRNFVPLCQISSIPNSEKFTMHRNSILRSLIYSIPKQLRHIMFGISSLCATVSSSQPEKIDQICRFFAPAIIRPAFQHMNIESEPQPLNIEVESSDSLKNDELIIDEGVKQTNNGNDGSQQHDQQTSQVESSQNHLNLNTRTNGQGTAILKSLPKNLETSDSVVKSINLPLQNSNIGLLSPRKKSYSKHDLNEYKAQTFFAWKTIVNETETLFSLEDKHASYGFERGYLLMQSTDIRRWIELLLDEYQEDRKLLDMSFAVMDAFIPIPKLISKLKKLYSQTLTLPNSTLETSQWASQRRSRIVFVLKSWIGQRNDFSNREDIIKSFEEFIYFSKNSVEGTVKTVEEESILSTLEYYVKRLRNPLTGSSPLQDITDILDDKITVKNLLSVPVQLLAESITLIDSKLFNTIAVKDCYGSMNGEVNSFANMANQFNKWSSWIQESILRGSDSSQRGTIINHCLTLINAFLTLHNFSAAYAVYSALKSLPISRISSSWKSAKAGSKLGQLDDLFSFRQNFHAYKSAISTCGLPAVPQIAVTCRHLAAMDESEPSYLPNGMINLEKLRNIYSIFEEVQHFQKSSYHHLTKNIKLIEQLLSLETMTDDELYNLSLMVEPKSSH